MRVNGRSSRDNLIQYKIKGRSQSTDRSKENNTVYNMGKSEPIRYTMEELKLIKRKVESNDKYRRLGIEVCYMIRKLRLNRQLRKKNIHEVKEERGILRSNLIDIKPERSLGMDMINRRFTIILSNVQSIKNKQDVIMELLEDLMQTLQY